MNLWLRTKSILLNFHSLPPSSLLPSQGPPRPPPLPWGRTSLEGQLPRKDYTGRLFPQVALKASTTALSWQLSGRRDLLLIGL